MSHVEEAEQVARGPRRRFIGSVAIATALVLGLAGVILGWHELGQRAETAESTTVSLAERVQERCETEGSLLVDDRDLCEQADDVVDDPELGIDPADGIDGRDGVDGVDGIDGRPGKDGRDGKDGKDGKDGASGPGGPGGDPGADGTAGVDGVDGADGEDGADGQAGAPGINGTNGRGIADITCHTTGDWIITLTDGTALTVKGPCRVAQPEPTPTATTTRK